MILIDGYPIDAALKEEHSFNSRATKHPIESGAVVSDHVHRDPISVTIEGVVSDTPMGDVADERQDALPSDEALSFLLQLREERRVVTIEDSLGVFENMVLGPLSVPRDARTGDALRFRAGFTQIAVVTNERTTVAVSIPKAKRKVNRGNRPSPEAAASDAEGGGGDAPQPSPKTKETVTKSWAKGLLGEL